MRRVTAVLLVLALCGVGASLAVGGMPYVGRIPGVRALVSSLSRLNGSCSLAGLRLLSPGVVAAAETLHFRTVPPESADIVAPRRRHAATPSAPEPAPPPASPEPPATPQIVKSGDVMRVGSDIHIARDEVVRGSVSAISGDVTVDGHVEGDVSALRGDVYLGANARVDGDVVSAGGQIHEEPGAYVGGQRVTALPGSRSSRLHRMVERETGGHVSHAVGSLVWMLILLGVAWAVTQLAPARTAAAVGTLQRMPLLSFGIGGLILALIIPSLIALCLVVAFLCITIIGIPFALAALLGYGMFFVVFGVWGFIVGAGVIGTVFVQRRGLASAPAAEGSSPATIPSGVLPGVALLTGMMVLGSLLCGSGMFGPLRFLGCFLCVITIILQSIVTVAGGGAWVRSEFETGVLGRWWRRRQAPAASSVPKPPAPPASPAPPATPPPPAPPSPPSAFAPPAADPWTPPPAG